MKQLIKQIVDRVLVDRIAERAAAKVSVNIRNTGWELRNSVNMFRLGSLLDAAPKDTAPNLLFGGVDDDFWLWLHTEGYRRSTAVRSILPGLPAEQIQFQYVGVIGDAAMRFGLAASRIFKELYERTAGRELSACKQVLDFGCGWGRIMRFLLKDIDPSKLRGIDVSDEMIAFCEKEFRWGTFTRNDPFPPTQFPAESFDFIYALSVFSHLSEDAHRKWLEEFKRILAPGGVLIATTWGRELITRCRDSRGAKDLTSISHHFPGLFVDTDRWLAGYDAGGFCFDSSRAGYGERSDWLGETCISAGYVMKHWPAYFDYLDYIGQGAHRDVFAQNIIVGRKAGGA
jgi:SAM-dependent methyltransferase